LRKSTIYIICVFTIIWVILTESLTVRSVLTGLVVSLICAVLCRKYLPFDKIAGVNYAWFLLYVVYLIGQMYVAAIYTIRLIIKGAKSDIIDINTEIDNDFLRVILANSITLVPGSVTLKMEGDKLTVLMLRDKKDEPYPEKAGERMKGKLEKMLLKAQK